MIRWKRKQIRRGTRKKRRRGRHERMSNRLLIYTSRMLRRKAECAGSGTPVPNLSRLIILHYAKRVFLSRRNPLINGCPVNGWHNTSAISTDDRAVSLPHNCSSSCSFLIKKKKKNNVSYNNRSTFPRCTYINKRLNTFTMRLDIEK